LDLYKNKGYRPTLCNLNKFGHEADSENRN